MELFSAEAESIQKRVEEWTGHPNYELEATFGDGSVNATTFLSVAQRLRAKGYTALPQEDHMTITTPEHLRFTLSSMGIIQQYCRDDTIAGKPFVAMIKERATADSQLDIEDYGVRIKTRRETPMASDDAKLKEVMGSWDLQRKAFRIIRRWSFGGPTDGIRIDMSIVRSTKRDRRGEFRWQKKFRDQDVTMAPPTYEIEVELLHKADDTPADAVKRLVRGIGEVLRGIQKSSVLIRQSVKAKVLAGYKELTGTDLFRGPSIPPLLKKNFSKERQKNAYNIRDGYNVTDKADGLRTLGYVDAKGDLYLIDMGLNVYKTGLRRPELRLSLVDGEWVTKTKDSPPKPMNQYLVFDIFYAADKRDVSRFPFQPGAVAPVAAAKKVEGEAEAAAEAAVAAPPPENSRHMQLKAWVSAWNAGDGPKVMIPGLTALTKLQVAAKEFYFGRAGDDSIFRMAARVLAAARPYYTDGLIFTPNALPLPSRPASTFLEQFKWKPPHDNTIDFYVRMEKKKESKTDDKVMAGVKPGTNETINYKTLHLYVGSRTENPRNVILNRGTITPADQTFRGPKESYRPVLFVPKEFPDPNAHLCNLEIHRDPDTGEEYVATEDGGEPIQDRTIVEMAYDPTEAPGWRWKPLRTRMDKTEKLQKGVIMRTLNSENTAEDTWNSIFDPISETMIRTGEEEPTEEELRAIGQDAEMRKQIARRYFERGAPVTDQKLLDGMKKFHTRWIKERILYKTGLSGESKVLLDLACGVAGDLHTWRRIGVDFVFGIDNAAKNIMGTDDGAYKRYMKVAAEAGGLDAIEPMVFAIADSSKSLVDGKAAGENQGEADILRSMFGRVKPVAPVPPFVEELGPRLKNKADCVSCMFAIHYMFESPEKLTGFLRNIADSLKVGGYFIGCCFDGDKVFQLLRGVPKGQAYVGMEGASELWRITKDYDEDEMPEGDEGFGMSIAVQVATIGAEHREYLVPFKLLEDKLRSVGCELLTGDELKAVGMVNSSATFDVSYEMAAKQGQKFPMGTAAQQFSFLNRWFIFRRKREAAIAEAVVAEAEAATAVVKESGAAAVAAATAAPGATAGRAAAAVKRANAASAAAAALMNGTEATPLAKDLATAAANAAAAVNAAGAPPPARTVPVAPGSAADPLAKGKTYSASEVFLFYTDAATSRDVLHIGDKGAGRWLAPSAPFPIEDPDDPTILYPTLEHYLAGMRVKLATNKPELAATTFSREGTIHQKFLNDRLMESNGGTKPLSEVRDHELLKLELARVKEEIRPASLKKYKATVDEAKWATLKDEVLEKGLKQRWTKDARFRRILEAARNQGKYLLYYTPGAATSNLGGVRSVKTDTIEGENKMGKIMMKLAGYTE